MGETALITFCGNLFQGKTEAEKNLFLICAHLLQLTKTGIEYAKELVVECFLSLIHLFIMFLKQ